MTMAYDDITIETLPPLRMTSRSRTRLARRIGISPLCHPERGASDCERESKDPLTLFVTTGSAGNSLISIARIPFPAIAG